MLLTDLKNIKTPLNLLKDKNIILIVTGGVAAYKAAELARLYTKNGAHVRTIMTKAATKFISPLTFESLTGEPVQDNLWAEKQINIEHIAWADWADVAVIAPATANFMAKMAGGLADDFASTFILAYKGPKVIAPAMNTNMYENSLTRENFKKLQKHGFIIVDSEIGLMACGTSGAGRLANIENIALHTAKALQKQDLKDKTFLISAGATQEPWDEIRYLTNRSSGKMGYNLALVAWLRGGIVKLIKGPQQLETATLNNLTVETINTCEELLIKIKEEISNFEYLIMAAAPADFKPKKIKGKVKKSSNLNSIELEYTTDILKNLIKEKHQFFIGFAAEDNNLIERAQNKLQDKNLNMIVANQAGGQNTAFGSDTNQMWLIKDKSEKVIEIKETSKFVAAWLILNEI